MKQKKHIWEAMVAIAFVLVVLLSGSTVIANRGTIVQSADVLDQHQEVANESILLPVGRLTIPDVLDSNFQVAQSFIPQKAILTRVEVSIGKNVTASYPFTLGIRDELTNPDLVAASVSAGDITTGNFSWVEFDVPDTWVTVGKTYYMVCYTENTTDNWYGWAANNDSASYPNGCAWVSTDDGGTWSNNSVDLELNADQQTTPKGEENATWDMVFRTYGLDATTLVIDRQPGLLQPKFQIKNAGSAPAYDVEVSARITGGMLNRINASYTVTAAELSADDSLVLAVGPLFGFGPITMTIVARATNAEDVSTEVSGFLLILFLIMGG